MGEPFYRKNRRKFWLSVFVLAVVLLSSLDIDHSIAQMVGKFLIARQLPDQGSTSMLLTIQPQLTVAPARPMMLPANWKVSQQICQQFGFPGEAQNPPGTYVNYLYSETANGIGMCCYVETDAFCSIDSGAGDLGTCPNSYNQMMLSPYAPGTMANFTHHLMGITGTYTSGAFPHWTINGCVYICGNYGSLPPCCAIPRPTTCTNSNPTPTPGNSLDCQVNWQQMTMAAPCGKGPIDTSGNYLTDPQPVPIGLDPHIAACYPFRQSKAAPPPGTANLWDWQRGSVNGGTLDTMYPGTWYPGQYIWPTPAANFQ